MANNAPRRLPSLLEEEESTRNHNQSRKHPLSFGKVSKRAVLSSKRMIWDSNDASIDVAQTAVDHWENAYTAMRGLLVATGHSAQGLYGAAKTGATGLEHGLLVPVRDWILLPAFGGVEHVVGETGKFLTSPQAAEAANTGLELVRKVPYVGEPFVAPALFHSFLLAQRAWHIAQYPIPSRESVRDSVDSVLTGTKWALSVASSEVVFYLKRLDANITRTLMHTQWKVLGSGPYATLDKLHRIEVLDHICERYFSIGEVIGRYEFAAHIRVHNPQIYRDLVSSGLLRERGGELTKDDEWLALCPSYRSEPFLMQSEQVVPLFFRLPYVNGKRPPASTPWQRFPEPERRSMEDRFQQLCQTHDSLLTEQECFDRTEQPQTPPRTSLKQYPTVAKWYAPNLKEDLLVDQKRAAVSFFRCCPKCRQAHKTTRRYGDFCTKCIPEEASIYPPSISMIMRPTMWRFHGLGDEVRRSVWFLDTKRHGLQPFSDEAAAILEDAYLFLKRMKNDAALLTVQVTSPDGLEQQLVQFTSIHQVTAIQKTLGGAISIFKRRVYRGVALRSIQDQLDRSHDASTYEEEQNDENWVDCANEPPVTFEESFESESELAIDHVHKEHTIVYTDKLLALPPTELDLAGEMAASSEKDIDHLVIIVHGIGEMLRSVDLFFGINIPNLSSIVDCCGYLRSNHAQVGKVQASLASVNGRVEYLPVEWHEAFSLLSQRQPAVDLMDAPPVGRSSQTNMNDISLRTIPNLRAFANDTLMDVLYFMSPSHHDLIIDIVTNEMNAVVQNFRELTGFMGDVSIIGHSLGSIITWDILDHQIPPAEADSFSPRTSCENLSQMGSSASDPSLSSRGSEAPQAPALYPQLTFRLQNAFFLGSPIAVFLMIRDSHEPLHPEYRLAGCKNIFNIFHPFDPVSYRIEPLLDNRNADHEPRIIAHWHGGFRVQYRTRRIWKKILDETRRTQQHMIEVVEAQMTGLGLLDSSIEYDDDLSDILSDDDSARRPFCGQLNQGRRIDYMLQEKEIESANEYVAALAAHSSYWIEKDLSLFVARQIVRSSLEAAIQADDSEFMASPQSSLDH